MSNKSKPKLYYSLESASCLTVIAVARILDLELDLIPVDLDIGEQNGKQFIKINPFKAVPAFVDCDDFTLSESRSIAAYLVQSRQPESYLYPREDLKTRASIDRFLQYDLGTFNRAITDIVNELFATGALNRKLIPRLEEVLKTFDIYLSTNTWPYVAGTHRITIADISLHFSWSLLDMLPEIDQSIYHAIQGWNRNVSQELRQYNQDGLFDEARNNLKDIAAQMLQGIRVF